MLTDRFGRVHDYLRLSLTDRCNLRCSYCMPAHPVFLPTKNLLTAPEISDLVTAFVSLGIKKIRLTGGEPLIRRDFDQIVKLISQHNVSLHLTTNGFYLDEHIDLVKKHFSSVNISLDTLRKDKFQQITQRNALEKTLQNIDLCLQKGIKTKLNVVIMRDVNHAEINSFVNLTRDHPLEIRFIEFMPFKGNQWQLHNTLTRDEIIRLIQSRHKIEILRNQPNQTAERFAVKGWPGSIGLISTVSRPFCESCNRIRLTAEGKVKNCLFGLKEFDLKPLLNNPHKLRQKIVQSLMEKHYSHGGLEPLSQSPQARDYTKNRSMTAIGG